MSQGQLQKIDDNRYGLTGDLTFQTVPALWKSSELALTSAGEVCLDLCKVERFDSSALALLIGWMEVLERKQLTLKLINVPTKMLDIARVSGLDTMLNIHWQP